MGELPGPRAPDEPNAVPDPEVVPVDPDDPDDVSWADAAVEPAEDATEPDAVDGVDDCAEVVVVGDWETARDVAACVCRRD